MDLSDIKSSLRLRYRLSPEEPTDAQLRAVLQECGLGATLSRIDRSVRRHCKSVESAPYKGEDGKDLRDLLYELHLELSAPR